MIASAPRYLRQQWTLETHPRVRKGDYVVAIKYWDGDPGDQFCIGIYDGCYDHYGQTRHLVVNSDGQKFRHNGFRRVAKVGAKRGEWMVRNIKIIEAMKDRFSVWHWYRAPWEELHRLDGTMM